MKLHVCLDLCKAVEKDLVWNEIALGGYKAVLWETYSEKGK